MAGDKTTYNFELVDDQAAFLAEMAKTYDLTDADKALRVLIDFAIDGADRDTIFNTVRCLRCG